MTEIIYIYSHVIIYLSSNTSKPRNVTRYLVIKYLMTYQYWPVSSFQLLKLEFNLMFVSCNGIAVVPISGPRGVHSMSIRVRGCRWSSKILITFIPCFKAKVRPINIPTRDQSLKIYTYLYT